MMATYQGNNYQDNQEDGDGRAHKIQKPNFLLFSFPILGNFRSFRLGHARA